MKRMIMTLTAAMCAAVGYSQVQDINGHDCVDMGLPSGTMWATCNIGATEPEQHGDCFAWGEVQQKMVYSWATYQHGKGARKLTKYCNDKEYGRDGFVDSKKVLDMEDDAANYHWGANWRIPTNTEWEELLNTRYCTWSWDKERSGYVVKSRKTGGEIFIPAVEYRGAAREGESGTRGRYWSSSLGKRNPSTAWFLDFNNDGSDAENVWRTCGHSIRPVYPK